jgi:hypothetical protein
MSTAFKKWSEVLSVLEAELVNTQRAYEQAQAEGRVSEFLKCGDRALSVDNLQERMFEAAAAIGKMRAKAGETDPDKQVYGKAMVAKVLDLGARCDAAVAACNKLWVLLAAEEAERLREEREAERCRASEAAELQRCGDPDSCCVSVRSGRHGKAPPTPQKN